MTDHFPLVVPGSKTASPAREGRRVMCCAPSLRLLFASSAIEATNELRDYFAAGSTGRVERPDYFCASGMIAPDFFRRGHVSCADLSAPDNRHTSNGGVLERIAKGVSTDHSSCGNDYKPLLSSRRNVHPQPRGAAKDVIKAAWLVAIMTVRAPPASRRRDSAPQTATSRLSSRTCRGSGAKRASSVAFHRRL